MVAQVLLLALAHAGSGDPIQGSPSWEERDLHLWTNAARLAPAAFAKDYAAGGCSVEEFTAAERLSVQPLGWSVPLGAVARAHSLDMQRSGVLTHDSSDGRTAVARIQEVYGTDKAFAENVARGFLTARSAVLEGWMCSAGHRENLLDPRWDEVGLGVADTWYTQDLGQGRVDPLPIGIAVHEPREPRSEADILMDVWSPEGTPPDRVEVVLSGETWPLTLTHGAAGAGIWSATVPADGRCTPWFVEATWGTRVERWPEEGSYAWGRCAYDDVEAGWLALQVEAGEGPFDTDVWEDTGGPLDSDPGDTDGDEVDVVPWSNLCSTLGGGLVALPLTVVAAGAVRRRRRS